MKTVYWLDRIPLLAVFFLVAVAILLSIWIGKLLGNRRRRKPGHEAEAPLGTVIGATLGLLAFMLAFTFGIAAELFQNRRQLLLDEVNAITTAYLRAELLLEPHQSEIRKVLREYVDTRVNLAKESQSQPLEKLQDALLHSEELQNQMWSHAVAMAEADRSSEIDALFISSLNEVIGLQNSRVTVFRYRIPQAIWQALFFITVLSMMIVGYQAGLSGKSGTKVAIVLAFTFSAVMMLVADLDRAAEGRFRVSQQPMFELQKKMQASTPQAELLISPDKSNVVGESPDVARTDNED